MLTEACGGYSMMWLFDSAATTDAGISFIRTISPEDWFAWEWHVGEKEEIVPTKGHLIKPRQQQRVSHQKHRLKNEYSGRRY